MYEVHVPTSWNYDGLASTQLLGEFDNRELAWDFVREYYECHGIPDGEQLMVRKPEFTEGRDGYPTIWDDIPDDVMELVMEMLHVY